MGTLLYLTSFVVINASTIEGKIIDYKIAKDQKSKCAIPTPIAFTLDSEIDQADINAVIDTLGNFKVDINLQKPMPIKCTYGFKGEEQEIELFVLPETQVKAEFHQEYLSKTFVCTGVGQDVMNYTAKKNLKFKEQFANARNYYNSANNFVQYKNKTLNEYKNWLNQNYPLITDTYTKQIFECWATAEVEYKLWNDFQNYIFELNPQQRSDLYTPLILNKLLPINNYNALPSRQFSIFLINHLRQQLSIDSPFEYGDNKKEKWIDVIQQYAQNIYDEKIRDIATTIILLKKLRTGHSDLTQELPLFKTQCKNPYYIQLVENEYQELQKNSNTEIQGIQTYHYPTDENVTLQKIKDQFKGKAIYIDVWATWCGPCIQEMKDAESNKIKEFFKNENIVFVYIMIDANTGAEASWRNIINKNKVLGHHILANKTLSADLKQNYNLKSLPAHLLINAKGIVINNNAPSLNQALVQFEIERALK